MAEQIPAIDGFKYIYVISMVRRMNSKKSLFAVFAVAVLIGSTFTATVYSNAREDDSSYNNNCSKYKDAVTISLNEYESKIIHSFVKTAWEENYRFGSGELLPSFWNPLKDLFRYHKSLPSMSDRNYAEKAFEWNLWLRGFKQKVVTADWNTMDIERTSLMLKLIGVMNKTLSYLRINNEGISSVETQVEKKEGSYVSVIYINKDPLIILPHLGAGPIGMFCGVMADFFYPKDGDPTFGAGISLAKEDIPSKEDTTEKRYEMVQEWVEFPIKREISLTEVDDASDIVLDAYNPVTKRLKEDLKECAIDIVIDGATWGLGSGISSHGEEIYSARLWKFSIKATDASGSATALEGLTDALGTFWESYSAFKTFDEFWQAFMSPGELQETNIFDIASNMLHGAMDVAKLTFAITSVLTAIAGISLKMGVGAASTLIGAKVGIVLAVISAGIYIVSWAIGQLGNLKASIDNSRNIVKNLSYSVTGLLRNKNMLDKFDPELIKKNAGYLVNFSKYATSFLCGNPYGWSGNGQKTNPVVQSLGTLSYIAGKYGRLNRQLAEKITSAKHSINDALRIIFEYSDADKHIEGKARGVKCLDIKGKTEPVTKDPIPVQKTDDYSMHHKIEAPAALCKNGFYPGSIVKLGNDGQSIFKTDTMWTDKSYRKWSIYPPKQNYSRIEEYLRGSHSGEKNFHRQFCSITYSTDNSDMGKTSNSGHQIDIDDITEVAKIPDWFESPVPTLNWAAGPMGSPGELVEEAIDYLDLAYVILPTEELEGTFMSHLDSLETSAEINYSKAGIDENLDMTKEEKIRRAAYPFYKWTPTTPLYDPQDHPQFPSNWIGEGGVVREKLSHANEAMKEVKAILKQKQSLLRAPTYYISANPRSSIYTPGSRAAIDVSVLRIDSASSSSTSDKKFQLGASIRNPSGDIIDMGDTFEEPVSTLAPGEYERMTAAFDIPENTKSSFYKLSLNCWNNWDYKPWTHKYNDSWKGETEWRPYFWVGQPRVEIIVADTCLA